MLHDVSMVVIGLALIETKPEKKSAAAKRSTLRPEID
jgi:hypothetical protein